jgi:hypothetical protein
MQIYFESKNKMISYSGNNYNADSEEGKRRLGFDLLN